MNREYICDKCYLLYQGYLDDRGREPCPSCGNKSPHATDTYACFYWEDALQRQHGPNFCSRHYWWSAERMSLDKALWLREYRSFQEVVSIKDGPPPPRPPAPDYVI